MHIPQFAVGRLFIASQHPVEDQAALIFLHLLAVAKFAVLEGCVDKEAAVVGLRNPDNRSRNAESFAGSTIA